MAETWAFRKPAGAACGDGDRESLSETFGASDVDKGLDSISDTWNRTEALARSIAAGTWEITARITTSPGAGVPANRITCLAQRRNSACVVQETILNDEQTVTQGTTCVAVTFLEVGVAQIDFAAGDILTIKVSDSNGSQFKTLCYNNADGSDHETKLITPDVFVVTSVLEVDVQGGVEDGNVGGVAHDGNTQGNITNNVSGVAYEDCVQGNVTDGNVSGVAQDGNVLGNAAHGNVSGEVA